MIGRLLILAYMIFVVPPVLLIMCGLIYGGVMEAIKYFST